MGPFDRGVSTYYLSCNRNKRGICVDFRQPAGLDVVRRLIAQADVVIENFKAGTMDAMGLGYAALSARDPRLVMGSVTRSARAARCATGRASTRSRRAMRG